MKNSELQTYLSRYAPDRDIGTLVVDVEKRLYYKIGAYQWLDGGNIGPVLILETIGSGPLDDVLEADEE